MKPGKAFELFIKHLLVNVGFTDVTSDGIYIFDGAAGQMLQGLGEAHNADVLLEPPVQTPFYSLTRLLIECKDYKNNVGLGVIREALAIREDINNFNIVDINELCHRRALNRKDVLYDYQRYSYQVAVASINGFTVPAQNFAAAYRIPLIVLNKMPFWYSLWKLFYGPQLLDAKYPGQFRFSPDIDENAVVDLADSIGPRMAVAITNGGQMLFLYNTTDDETSFEECYSLHWYDETGLWSMRSGDCKYLFQLPDTLMKIWLDNARSDLEIKQNAINCKAGFMSNMVVYYKHHGLPTIKMISIDKFMLERARENLG